MEPVTIALAVIAALSEILPLVGITEANGLLHGLQTFVRRMFPEEAAAVPAPATEMEAV